MSPKTEVSLSSQGGGVRARSRGWWLDVVRFRVMEFEVSGLGFRVWGLVW